MSEQKNENNESVEQVIEGTAETVKKEKKSGFESDIFIRIFLSFLFALIGWLTLWVFGAVVLIQAGFLIVTGEHNKNLKAFSSEVGGYLANLVKYVSFQTDEKPFPFQSWGNDDNKNAEDNGQTA